MSGHDFFDVCVNRINEDILPLLDNFPPTVPNDKDGDLLNGSIDLLLYRNLLFTIEFCFRENDDRLSTEQFNSLRSIARKQVIPAYLNFFKNNFLLSNGQASSFFFVRQENNSCWAKLIWKRICEIYFEQEEKSEDSHRLGVRIPSGVLDVLARLLEIFFPTEEVIEKSSNVPAPKKEFSSKISRKFSLRRFELLNFDVRRENPKILEAVLQRALSERDDPITAKNAFYVLSQIVSFSRETSHFELETSENIFVWSKCSAQLLKWEKFIAVYGSLQEAQIHLLRPLLPVIHEIMKEFSSGWWRTLFQKGLFNDSIPIRRLILHFILSETRGEEDMKVLCTPEGLDFCLEDLLVDGLDANTSFLVAPQHIVDGETGPAVDLGDAACSFFAQIIINFSRKSNDHARAIVREVLTSIERFVRAPVAIIYILKAFAQVAPCLVLEDVDLGIISKISSLTSLHNQRARLLIKSQLLQLMIRFSDPAGISFAQLATTLNDLLSESLALGNLNTKTMEFSQVSRWLDETFGATFLNENLTISIQRFYRSEGSLRKAQTLSLLAVFTLGSGDGRFAMYSRLIFERLAVIYENPKDATSAFTLFLALNETVKTVLCGDNDLLSQLGMDSRIFEWLEFIDTALFGPNMCSQVDFYSSSVLLEVFNLLIDRASENDKNQLIQFLDIHLFSLTNLITGTGSMSKSDANTVQVDVGFKRLLTISTAMSALGAILKKIHAINHLQHGLITPEAIQKTIMFKLERPGGLSETEWDQWPEFVTYFTAAKWKCIESMAYSLLSAKDPKEDLLSVLASCLQALEVSKFGGILAILKCLSTLFDLILETFSSENDDRQLCALMSMAVQIGKTTLRGGSETQRWFDAYAEHFIILFFRKSVLKASESNSLILESIQEMFDFIAFEIGPKRRGIVSLMSSRLGEYWIGNNEALSSFWRGRLIQLLLYGGSPDETVDAGINREHGPDSDYQVRVHAATVLNHIKDSSLARDILVDLLGQQEAHSSQKKRMFPGDFDHRLKLRSWAAILLLIGVLCNLPDGLDKDFVESNLLQNIWRLVRVEKMSSTRIFMEWALSRLYLQFPSLITDDFISIRVLYRDGDVPTSLVVSMIAIVLNMVKKMKQVDKDFTLQVFLPTISDIILPLLVHKNRTVRMNAIYAFKRLEYEKRKVGLETNVLGYKLLAGFIESAEHCQKFIKKLDNDVFVSPTGLDPIEDFSLDWIFGKLMILGGVEDEAIEYYSFMNYRETSGSVPFRGRSEDKICR